MDRATATHVSKSLCAVFLVASLFGCEESPYASFCEDLDGGDYKQCLSNESFRLEYVDVQVADHVDLMLAVLKKLPASTLSITLTDDIRQSATRVDSGDELPVQALNWEITAESHPELVGKYFVMQTGGHGMSGDEERSFSIFVDLSDNEITMFDGERLTDAQQQFMELVCDVGGQVCAGDYFVQLLPDALLGALTPQFIGADLAPITASTLRKAHHERMTAYLQHLDKKASE